VGGFRTFESRERRRSQQSSPAVKNKGATGKRLDALLMEVVCMLDGDQSLARRNIDHPRSGEWSIFATATFGPIWSSTYRAGKPRRVLPLRVRSDDGDGYLAAAIVDADLRR